MDIFDPKSFVISSPLNGKKATIVDALAIRHNYGGTRSEETTAVRLEIDAGWDANRINLIACGDLWPSEDKKTKASAGPFLCGGLIEKRSNIADFINGLAASGFPMEKLRDKGFFALNGAEFVWKSFEKRVGKEMKVYDIPAEFIGFKALEEAEDTSTSKSEAGDQSEDLKADVMAAVIAALEKHNQIPRGQLSIRVGPMLKAHPKKAEALALLMDEKFLGSIPETWYQKGILSNTPF